jgi:hypothetical protein
VWVPKYQYRVLQGLVGKEAYRCVMVFCQQLGCEVVGLNVQVDHVHYEEMIQKYVEFREKEEQHQEQLQLEPRSGPSRKGR